MQKKYSILLLISALAYSSCGDRTSQKSTETTAVPEETRLAISISKRQLAVIEGQDTIERFAVAVGKEGHPTPEGEFEIHQIDHRIVNGPRMRATKSRASLEIQWGVHASFTKCRTRSMEPKMWSLWVRPNRTDRYGWRTKRLFNSPNY